VRQCLLTVQFHLFADLQMLAAKLLLDLPPGPGTLVEAQERLAGQQLWQALAGQVGAGDRPETVFEQGRENQALRVGADRFRGDRCIQLAVFDPPCKFRRHP